MLDPIKSEAIINIAESGSISAAAVKLGYTQPGITRMLNAIEEELGFPLFARTKKGAVLTENGKQILPLLKEILHSYKLISETSSEIRGILNGTLTIGCYYSISAMILPQILTAFLQDFPQVKIIIKEGTNSELSQWLQDGTIDFTFSAKPDLTQEFEWLPILKDELTVWLPQTKATQEITSFSPQEIEKYPFIMTQPNNDTDIDRIFSKFQIQANVKFTTKDAYATYKMVEAGLGISLNQRLIAKDWHGMVTILPFTPPQFIELGIALLSLKDASPASKKFISYIKNLSN